MSIAFALGLVLGWSVPVLSSAATHFPHTNAWGDDGYEIDSAREFPLNVANFVSRVNDSATEWSSISGSGLDFIYDGQRGMASNLTVQQVSFDETWIMDYWTTGVWNYPGCGQVCVLATAELQGTGSSGAMAVNRVLIRVNHDDDLPWYLGNGNPLGNQFDLWSVLAHEFGHAAGALDFYGTECDNFYTICGIDQLGTTWRRTLTQHEKDDMAAKY